MAQIFKAKTLVSNTGKFAYEATAPNLVYNTGYQNIDGTKNFYHTPTINGDGILSSGQKIIGGDLTGNLLSSTVNKLQGYPLSINSPSAGQTLIYNGSTWIPGANANGGGGGGGLFYYFDFLNTGNILPTGGLTGIAGSTLSLLGRTYAVGSGQYISPDLIPENNFRLLTHFVTASGDPGIRNIPAGLWDFNIWASTDSASSVQTAMKAVVNIYDPTNSTYRYVSESDQVYLYDTTTVAQYLLNVTVPQTGIKDNERLYIQFFGKKNTNPARTITFYFDSYRPSHVHTTIPSIAGSGVVKVIDGVYQTPASTIVDIDVNNNANIQQSKIQNLTTDLSHLNNKFSALSGNLISTGLLLNEKIDSLSGVSVLTFGDQTIGGVKTFIDRLDVEGNASNNSTLKVGTLEFQPYSVNNAWFGDNAYYDGGFYRRNDGYAGLFYFAGPEGQFRFFPSDGEGTSFGNSTQLKIHYDGRFGIGSSIDNNPNDFTNSNFFVNSDGHVGIGTISPGELLDVNGNLRLSYGNSNIYMFDGPNGDNNRISWSDNELIFNNRYDNAVNASAFGILFNSGPLGEDSLYSYRTEWGATQLYMPSGRAGYIAVNSDLVATGFNLNTKIDSLSGYVDSKDIVFSGQIFNTGSRLDNKINSLSGVSVLTFGNQNINGVKVFNNGLGARYISGVSGSSLDIIGYSGEVVNEANRSINIQAGHGPIGIPLAGGSINIKGGNGINDGGGSIVLQAGNAQNTNAGNINLIAGTGILNYAGGVNIYAGTSPNYAGTNSIYGNININSDGGFIPSSSKNIKIYRSGMAFGLYPYAAVGVDINNNRIDVNNGMVLQVSGVDVAPSLYATSINLASTGSTLNSNINSLSGTITGNYATIINLATTGSTLDTKINNLSGYVNSYDSNIVFTTGNQTIAGIKQFASSALLSARIISGFKGSSPDSLNLIGTNDNTAAANVNLAGNINLTAGTGVIFGTPAYGAINLNGGGSKYDGQVNLNGNINLNNITPLNSRTINIYKTGVFFGSPGVVPGLTIYNDSVSLNTPGGVSAGSPYGGFGLYVSGVGLTPGIYVNTKDNQIITGAKTFVTSGIFSLSGANPLVLPNNPLSIVGSGNTYLQLNIQNRATGNTSTADLVITANNGTDSSNFINLGINNSGYSDPAFSNGGSYDGYLFINGGSLDIGTQTANTSIEFHIGGTTIEKTVARLSNSGLNVITGDLVVNNSGIFGGVNINDADAMDISGVAITLLNSTVTSNYPISGSSILGQSGVFLSGIDLKNSNLINATPQIINLSTNFNVFGNYNSRMIMVNSATEVTAVIVSGNAFGFNASITQVGAGKILVTGSGIGINIGSYNNQYKTAGQFATVSVLHTGSNGYIMYGNTAS